MCGLSGTELFVIVVVAVIVLGPEKLPELMRWVGRAAREVRKLTGDIGKVSSDLRSVVSVDDLKKQLREEMQIERVRSVRTDAEQEIDAIRARMRETARQASAEVSMPTIRAATGAVSMGPDVGAVSADAADAADAAERQTPSAEEP